MVEEVWVEKTDEEEGEGTSSQSRQSFNNAQFR